MKRLLLSALAALTTLSAVSPAFAEGKILYQPYPADVNRYRYALNQYERNGGFSFNDAEIGKCSDPFRDVRIEGRVLSVLIDKCLADKLMAKRYMGTSAYPTESYVVESFQWNLQLIWSKTIAPNTGWHELKLRNASGGALGSITNGSKWTPPAEGKAYVSTRN